MDILTTIHSHDRWIIFLLGAAAFVFCLAAFLAKKALSRTALLVVRLYTLMMTFQFVIGVVQLIGRWDDAGVMLRHRLEHAFCMLLALTVLHMRGKWSKGTPVGTSRNMMLVVLTSIILVVLGITVVTMPKGVNVFGM
ncbi:hypothetical protein BH10BAC6_BH10BAC6_10080 [soil metagenome]